MSDDLYVRVRGEYEALNRGGPRPVTTPRVDLSIKTSDRLYINPEISMDCDISLWINHKERAIEGDTM